MTVCTGNICRSPMAEVVLRARLDAAGLGDRVEVDSTGVSDEEHGNPVDRRARAALTARGYEVPVRAARQVRPRDLEQRDLVLAMTAQHARALRRLVDGGRGAEHVRLYRSFDPDAPVASGASSEHLLDVEDPWYGGPDDFEDCLTQIEAAADGVIGYVRSALDARP